MIESCGKNTSFLSQHTKTIQGQRSTNVPWLYIYYLKYQYQISQQYNIKNLGLYRDDGLVVFKNVSGPKSERIKKTLQMIFKANDLDIVIECNRKIVNYLDITLNLEGGTYRPYHKPDSNNQYIHKQSNHAANIIDKIPKSIEKRLSDHSSNETVFNQSKAPYEKALKNSG